MGIAPQRRPDPLGTSDSRQFDKVAPPETLRQRIRAPEGGGIIDKLHVRTANGVVTSALGAYTLVCSHEVDGGGTVNCLSTANFNLETLADQTDFELTLTSAAVDLRFQDGDHLLLIVVSTNADLLGTGVIVTASWRALT